MAWSASAAWPVLRMPLPMAQDPCTRVGSSAGRADCAAGQEAEVLDGGGRAFLRDRWQRNATDSNAGYGITAVLEGGDLLEKARNMAPVSYIFVCSPASGPRQDHGASIRTRPTNNRLNTQFNPRAGRRKRHGGARPAEHGARRRHERPRAGRGSGGPVRGGGNVAGVSPGPPPCADAASRCAPPSGALPLPPLPPPQLQLQ